MELCIAGGTTGLGLMTANLSMFLDIRDFILLGRTAHVSNSADFVNLAYAHCLTTVMRADVSCFGEIANAINLVRFRSCCKHDVMHAAGLQVCHIHGSGASPSHIKHRQTLCMPKLSMAREPSCLEYTL